MRWYKMDETAWTNDCSTDSVFDSSGNTKHGDACPSSTGPVGGATGKYNNAGSFDGSDDFVKISSPALPTGDFSYSMWVNLTDTTNETIVMSGEDSGGTNELNISVANGLVEVRVNGGSADVTSSQSIPTSTWTHITVTRSGSTQRIYINGKLDPNTGSDGTTLSFGTCALLIGVDADAIGSNCSATLGEYATGAIDDIRVYGYALTSQQISSIMNEGAVRFGPQTGSP